MGSEIFDTVGTHTFTVPSGVSELTVKVWGSYGGNNRYPGGYVEGTLAVTAGEDLDVNVGETTGTRITGGEMSDIRQGGTSLSDQVVVGGGGGGSGNEEGVSNGKHGSGGEGGADTGQDGDSSGTSVEGASAGGGSGGTQSAGGSGGNGDFDDGDPGTRGSGGVGGGPTNTGNARGGEGGDGYYGGGGGGADQSSNTVATGGGGGGSNYDDGLSSVTSNQRGVDASNGGDGKVVLEWVQPPDDPSGLSATTFDEDRIDLSWTLNSSNEDSVRVERREPGETSYSQIASLGAGTTSYSDTGLDDGSQYQYRVRACNSAGCSGYSGSDSATTDMPAPTSASASVQGDTSIEITWVDNAADETGYLIQRSTSGGSFSTITTEAANSTSYTDTGLDAGTDYQYRVRAQGDDKNSSYDTTSTVQTTIAAPTGLSATAASESQIDLSWTDNSGGETGYEIQRRRTGGSFSTITTEAADSTTYADTGLDNGESYDYRVRATGNDANSSWSSTATDITDFAAITGLMLDATVEDELTAQWDDTANYGDYHVEYKETDAGTYTDEGTVGQATTSKTITGLEDGERYDVRVRHETEHGSGSYTEVTDVTKLPAPPGLSLDDTDQNELTATWTRNDDSTDGDHRILRSTDGSTGSEIDTTAYNTTTYVDDGLATETKFHYTVRRQTDHVFADSSQVAHYTKPPAPSSVTVVEVSSPGPTYFVEWVDEAANEDGYEILLDESGFTQIGADLDANVEFAHVTGGGATGEDVRVRVFVGSGSERAEAYTEVTAPHTTNSGYRVVVEPLDADAYQSARVLEPNIPLEYSAMCGGRVSIPEKTADRTRDGLAPIYVYADDERLIRGTVENLAEDTPRNGWTQLAFRGPMLDLTRTGPTADVSYSNISYTDALTDYVNNQAGGSMTATIHEPPTSVATDDSKIDDAPDLVSFTTLYAPADDEPVEVDANGIRALRTSFTGTAPDFDGLASIVQSDFQYSGEYYISTEAADVQGGESVIYEFTPKHDIPASRVGIKWRQVGFAANGELADVFTVTFNGDDLSKSTYYDEPDWQDATGRYTGGDLEAGTTYQFEYRIDAGAGSEVRIDAINIYDKAHPPTTWDNPPGDGSGQAAGPENYPTDQQIELKSYTRPYNITDGRIDATWNNTSNGQEVALSNDSGKNFLTAANSADITADFDAAGNVGFTLVPRITLSGYGTFGQADWLTARGQGQEMTSYEVYLTTTDLPAIGAAGVNLRRTDYANIKQLCDNGGLNFVVEPGELGVVFDVFVPDDPSVQKTLAADPLDRAPRERELRGYANRVNVVYKDAGGIDKFTAQDQSEIDRVGEAVPAYVFAPDVSTSGEASDRADTELRKRVARDEDGGQIPFPPSVYRPGFAYQVDAWDGDVAILERTTYRGSTNRPRADTDFVSDRDMTSRTIGAEREVDDVKQTITEN